MAAELRPYGAGTTIRVPLLAANDGNFATDSDWTPGAGDVKVSKDGGAQANIATLPTFANGRWTFTLSATEMEAAVIEVNVIDAALLDDGFTVETYGHASAMHELDLGSAFENQIYPPMALESGSYADFDAAIAEVIAQCAVDPPAAEGLVQGGSSSTVVILNPATIGPEHGFIDAYVEFIYTDGFREGRHITAYDNDPPTVTLSEALRGTLVTDGSADNTIYKIWTADLVAGGGALTLSDIFTTPLTESYSTVGQPLTLAQFIYEMIALHQEAAKSGATISVKQRNGTSQAFTLVVDNETDVSTISRGV